jgi:hypothetical protein
MKTSNQINQTQRVRRAYGSAILEQLNTVYGYYATARTLSETEFAELLAQPTYTGPVHEAEARHDARAHICG